MIIEDNREKNINGIHVNKCKIGDLYKPWYFYKNKKTGAPNDIDQVCLIYNIENKQLDPNNIPASSFLKIPTDDDFHEYNNPTLTESIKNDGQKNDIICTKHYTTDAPLNIGFLEDPELKDIHCFEGHHRVVSTVNLDINVNAEIYSLYHMDYPINYSKYYNSLYDNTFWSSFQTIHNRQPWFKENEFDDSSKTFKYKNLKECFDFIKTLDISLSNGIDIGCAEGAYTFFANNELNIPMQGVDIEIGRIIRGLLMKNKHNKTNVNYKISNWLDDTINYDTYDFAMLLSILHHVDNPNMFFEKMSKNKKVLIVEARINKTVKQINSGSMIAINTKEFYEDLFTKFDYKFKHMSMLNDRAFYVCWR